MAKIPDKVKNTVERFLQALKKNNIPINRVILFGSYARGNYTECIY